MNPGFVEPQVYTVWGERIPFKEKSVKLYIKNGKVSPRALEVSHASEMATDGQVRRCKTAVELKKHQAAENTVVLFRKKHVCAYTGSEIKRRSHF